jgi:predicted MFS family arabinose efflux permease
VRTGPSTIGRIRGALAGDDFRRLFAIRLVSQFADGLFQSALVASVVFAPEQQDTAVGLLKATLIVALPYSILGPFTGVFIDRWRRRLILILAPWVKAAAVGLVLFDPIHDAMPFFAGALLVISVNRFFLSTAAAIVPRLVPNEDLLVANSLAQVGGTVALLTGVFLGGWVVDAVGGTTVPVVIAAGVGWIAASWIASRITTPLRPHTKPEDPELLRHQLRRVGVEFADGARRLLRSPRAIGPITSITLDQIGQGIVLTMSLVVFRHRFGEGVGSFSNLIGAGGVGVLVGIVSVGALEERLSKPAIVSWAFVAGGIVLLAASLAIRQWSVLLASFAVGLTFAWKKISVDTMVQEALPDGYRGRVFSVYDVFYNLARVVAAALAIPLLGELHVPTSLAVIGAVFIAWAPVATRWYGREPELRLRFYAGARADEVPRSILWGGAEEPVEVLRSWHDERDGERRLAFRLALGDGTVLDVSRPEPDGSWRLDREGDRPLPTGPPRQATPDEHP